MSKDYSEDLLIKNSTLDHLHPKVDEWRNKCINNIYIS